MKMFFETRSTARNFNNKAANAVRADRKAADRNGRKWGVELKKPRSA